jgi:hypothetical protein
VLIRRGRFVLGSLNGHEHYGERRAQLMVEPAQECILKTFELLQPPASRLQFPPQDLLAAELRGETALSKVG